MNTNDFQPLEYNPDNCWKIMFDKQKEVFKKYLEVEKSDWNEEDFSVDCLQDQELLKEFAWRIVEELTEMTEDIEHKDHYLEELVDSMNFLIELMIIYGWDKPFYDWQHVPYAHFDKTKLSADHVIVSIYSVIEAVGQAMNLLKNRKWKEQHYLVDLYKFEPRLKKIFTSFNLLVNELGVTEKMLFEVWSQKLQVNAMRLETKY